jgi:heterodisulfide reductase subunit C
MEKMEERRERALMTRALIKKMVDDAWMVVRVVSPSVWSCSHCVCV